MHAASCSAFSVRHAMHLSFLWECLAWPSSHIDVEVMRLVKASGAQAIKEASRLDAMVDQPPNISCAVTSKNLPHWEWAHCTGSLQFSAPAAAVGPNGQNHWPHRCNKASVCLRVWRGNSCRVSCSRLRLGSSSRGSCSSHLRLGSLAPDWQTAVPSHGVGSLGRFHEQNSDSLFRNNCGACA